MVHFMDLQLYDEGEQILGSTAVISPFIPRLYMRKQRRFIALLLFVRVIFFQRGGGGSYICYGEGIQLIIVPSMFVHYERYKV